MRWANDDGRVMLGLAVTVVIVAVGGIASADFTFGEATTTAWPPVNTLGGNCRGHSPDELTFYFSNDRPGGYGGVDLYVSTRSTTNDPWGEPENLGPVVNSPSDEFNAIITSDGLELYFCSNRPGGYGSNDIWMTKRETKDGPWSQPVALDPPSNGPTNAWSLQSISSDDLEMFFVSGNIPGGYGGQDIWTIKRATRESPWGAPVNAGPNVNSGEWDNSPVLLPDDLTLIFSSARLGGFSTETFWDLELWMARRETKDSPWGQAVNLGSTINTEYCEMGSLISADGRMLYFSYHSSGVRPGGNAGDRWQAPIIPITDLTGDGRVDGADVCTMVDCWGTDASVCDIGPIPLGDGIVDIEDLKVLAEYIGKPLDDPTLVSHWALDEAEGFVAADCAGDCDGVLLKPLWQPDAGHVGGALELDGTFMVMAPLVVDPAIGPFSVLAWVKGGSPGQVIISQKAGANWLMLDPATGALTTELKSGGRSGTVLYSDAIITDGTWHRVGFTWDGSTRSLYVDDMLVAEDTQDKLAGCTGGLNIGTGHNMAPGTYWTGLIDDVRIYSRPVNP